MQCMANGDASAIVSGQAKCNEDNDRVCLALVKSRSLLEVIAIDLLTIQVEAFSSVTDPLTINRRVKVCYLGSFIADIVNIEGRLLITCIIAHVTPGKFQTVISKLLYLKYDPLASLDSR